MPHSSELTAEESTLLESYVDAFQRYDVEGNRIIGWNGFLDTETLFPMFGLPLQMAA